MVVLGVKGKTMMQPTHLLFISVQLPSARCTRLVFVPTTIIGTNSIVNLKKKEVRNDTVSCDIIG